MVRLGTSATSIQLGNGPVTNPWYGRIKLKGVDWLGISLILVGLKCFFLALIWDDQMFAWRSWQTVIPFVFGLVVVCSLLAVDERYQHEAITRSALGGEQFDWGVGLFHSWHHHMVSLLDSGWSSRCR